MPTHLIYKKLHATLLSISLLFIGSAPLHAFSHKISHKIHENLERKNYEKLGEFLKEEVNHSHLSLDAVKKVAEENNAHCLLKAVDATEQYKKVRRNLSLSKGAFLQLALFMETKFQKKTAHGQKYFRTHKTDLPRKVEYDPHTKHAFIILDGAKSAFLGEGYRKRVYKAIEYDPHKLHIVARANQRGGMKNEKKITKRLLGMPGVLALRGFGKHRKSGRKYTTVYTELYNFGDLKGAFKKKIKFSLSEKMKIALDILHGLESLRKKKIIHRDLGAKNIFLNRSKGAHGKRHIEAVLADFGCSKEKWRMHKKRAQVGIRHTAPEGLYYDKLSKSRFYRTDLYAAGLILYQLFYGKAPIWQTKHLHHDSRKAHYHWLSEKIDKTTHKRRKHLAILRAAHKTSAKDDFEHLILHMVKPDSKKRGTAKELRKEMQHIIKKHTH